MKKVIITVSLNLIIFIAFYIIYFFDMAYSMYGVQFVRVFTPIALVLMTFIFFVLNKLILRHNLKMNILVLFSAIIIFVSLTTYITSKYDYLFKHFFEENHYSDLWQLNEYKKEPGNFFNVKKVIENSGVKVTYIKRIEKGFYLINSHSIKYGGEEYLVQLDNDFNEVVDKISVKEIINKQMNIVTNKEDFKKVLGIYIYEGGPSIEIEYHNKEDLAFLYTIEFYSTQAGVKYLIKDEEYEGENIN